MNDARRKPTDFDDLFPGRFLKAGQLGDKRPTLTISAVDVDDLPNDKGGEQTRGVLTFREMKYQLVVNKTNALCLKAMFGRKAQEWIGHRITLYAGKWNGEPAVRIWGSPEIKSEITVPIKLPRRAESKHILHPVSPPDAQRKPDVAPHPTEGNAPPPEGGERPPY